MTSIDPRTTDEVYESLKDSLQGKIVELTNFAENSFNYVWTQAFAEKQHDEEVAALATQFSGWADYAGKEITQEDLDRLNITGTTPEEVNEYMDDGQLDQLAKMVAVSRDEGTESTGQVEVSTSTGTTIPEGVEFGTQPDNQGEFLSFFTTEEVTTQSATTVTVDIQAEEVGDKYNVGAGTITYMPNPPVGVESVTNTAGTTGGTDQQSTESLREDVKNAVLESAEGGTKDAIEAYVDDTTDALDVLIQEQFTGDSDHGNYPHADVVVLGGTDSEVNDAIDFSHPSGVEHILVRPEQYGINITANVEGTDIDTTLVEENVSDYFDALLLGDDVIRDKVIQAIMNGDDDIENITPTDGPYIDINKEEQTFVGQLIDDFEDQDITVAGADWSGWSGDTGSFTAQNGTVISGSYTGELTANNANVSVNTTRSSPTSNDRLIFAIQMDNQTTNSSDVHRVILENGSTRLGRLEFDGAGNIEWYNGSSNNVGSWSASSTLDVELDINFVTDTIDIDVNGNTLNAALENSVNEFDTITLESDTTASGSTVNTFIDGVENYDATYKLIKGDSMEQSTGIVDVENPSGTSYTETTDYDEGDNDEDGTLDAIEWIDGGTKPSYGESFFVTYRIADDIPINAKEVANSGNISVAVV